MICLKTGLIIIKLGLIITKWWSIVDHVETTSVFDVKEEKMGDSANFILKTWKIKDLEIQGPLTNFRKTRGVFQALILLI